MPLRNPSQTVGPYYAIALPWKDGGRVTGCGGERLVLTGRVLDGAGAPIPDALVETFQPAQAHAADGKPHGFARASADALGTYRIETTLPDGAAPYLDVIVLARGLLKALHTRVYFAGEAAVRKDPVLAGISGSPRIATLIASQASPGEWRWDIRLQGAGETVFFEPA